jgi:ABC-type multidrug transport system fused ATPase/permease subunit
VYQNQKEICPLDDPISALDAHVRTAVFNEVIMGKLKGKSRILATHAVEFMRASDRIIVMEAGRVTGFGTFEELATNHSYF